MNKKTLILLLLWLLPFSTFAQLSSTGDSLRIHKKTKTFQPLHLILPLSLVTVGVIGVSTPPIKKWNRDLRDDLAVWRDGRYFHADDYVQYLPVISHLGLNLLGAKPKHTYVERILTTATSYAVMGIMVNVIKWSVSEQRPDRSTRNTFPSGHTATAFMGAELVRMEYKDDSPLYGVGAYTIACGVAFLRMYNERHWSNDVMAGAGIGILSARIGFWLLPLEKKLFNMDRPDNRKTNVTVVPSYDPTSRNIGAMVAIRF